MKNFDFPELSHIFSEDRLELLECLSAKDDSETYLVRSQADDRLFVAKLYPAGSLMYNFSVPEEIRNLCHPSIPSFIKEVKTDSYRYELRDYIPGKPLSETGPGFSEQQVIDLACKLCDILSYLHHLPDPVIHRDIKPANVVQNKNGDVFLIDFGIARTRHNRPEDADTIVCGTKEFCSPEQFGFMQTDARSDIFSFGRLLARICPAHSSRLHDIIQKCTRFDPSKRYASIDKVKRDLLRLTPEFRRKRRLLISIAAALLCISVLGGLWIRSTRVRFQEPLLEQAVLCVLNRPSWMPVFPKDLKNVQGLYVVGECVYSEEEAFYRELETWYEKGNLPNGSIVSLEDCGSMTSLKQLCIAGEQITELTPLSDLVSLEKLEVKHNRITDISPIAGLTGLSSVGLNGNPVTDLTALVGLPNLRYLDLCNVNAYDEAVFDSLDNFEYLDIDNRTRTYQHLSGKTIRRLRLGSIFTGSLDFLKTIHGLEEVRLNNSADHYMRVQKLGDVSFNVVYE